MIDRDADQDPVLDPDPAPATPPEMAPPEMAPPEPAPDAAALPEAALREAAPPEAAVDGTADPSAVHLRRWVGRALRGGAVGIIAVAIFVAGVGVDRTGLLGGPAARATPAAPQDFALIEQAWNLLHTQYVEAKSLDSKQLAYGAIDGMTNAVGDTGHTSFMTPAERAEASAALSGSYAGIGAELDSTGGQPTIVGVIRGGPAEAAGLQAGDQLLSVDGKDVSGESLDLIAGSIRGPAGTSVTLTLQRAGATSPITLTIVRAKVTIRPVSWAPVPGTDVAMLRVESFSHGASDQFGTALKAALATHPSGLILDLRNNPGGYVNEAVGIASQFLTSGNVYLTRDASGKETSVAVRPGALAPSIPLVVLVDNGTASSAEIVAGALQDAGRATIVGTPTFGTGTVLAEYPLADGSALRIGTVEWLTPKGHLIWHHGITPDQTVTLPTGVRPVLPDDLSGLGASGVTTTKDAQLRKAIADLTSGG